MRLPASTDREVLLREINEAEAALAEISQVIQCTCIIDPTETLGDRVRHLGEIVQTVLNLNGALRKATNAKLADATLDQLEGPMTMTELLKRFDLGEN